MAVDPAYLTHSLAEARPGESLEILDILFEESRRRCAAAGVVVGIRARCRSHVQGRIQLELPDGRTAEIDGDLAPFIAVHVLESTGAVDLPRSIR